MCNIVRYWYTCNHSLRMRRSQCGGTKHKRSTSGPAPACKPESYLSIFVPIDCGPCQHLAFEENWKRKLSRAELFIAKLKEKGFSGEQELAALVEQLKDEFNAATWDTRSLFPHVHKDRAVRINLGRFVRRPSPLRHEVFNEDIRGPSDNVDPNNPDCEYDWDYVASTDPLHPVDINYAHPLDDVDPCWMLNHLSLEEFQQSSSGVGFDPREADTLWSAEAKQLYSGPTYWGQTFRSWSPGPVVDAELQAQEPRQRHGMLNEQTLASTPIDTSIRQDEWGAGRANMVIGEFWRFVNGNNHNQPQHHDALMPNAEPLISLNDLHESGPSSSHSSPHVALPTLHQTPPQSSPDTPLNSQYSTASSSEPHIPPPATTAPTDHHTAAVSQSSSNSTRTRTTNCASTSTGPSASIQRS